MAVPIASLKPGDKVLATNTRTGKTKAESVAAVLVHHDTNRYDLTVKTSHGVSVIHTTSNHLFWDLTQHKWVKAGALRYGDLVGGLIGLGCSVPGSLCGLEGAFGVSPAQLWTGWLRSRHVDTRLTSMYGVGEFTVAVAAVWAGGAEGAAGDAADALTFAPEDVPDPLPQYKPSGSPDRTSAVFINVRTADGTITTVGSVPRTTIHAEDVAQELAPGGQMSRPFGWRMNKMTGNVEWQPIDVCTVCQVKYPPELFPSGTVLAPGGAWGEGG